MFVDITGKKRLKMGLHTHTTLSDGHKTPEEVIGLYAAAGYDVLAITDHWQYAPTREVAGMTVLSGAEYDMSGANEPGGIILTFHILAIGMTADPRIPITLKNDPQIPIYERVRTVVRMVREAGGLAILAHPAWSLNTPEQIMEVCDFDGVEIYNSVSDFGMSDRPYSGLIVDMLGARGVFMPLLATDDVHYYVGDEMRGMIMVEADAAEELGILGAIRAQRYYSTQGPEIHLERVGEDQVRLVCSSAVKVAFFSELTWCKDRIFRGEGITEASYTIRLAKKERFVRAEVTDEKGLTAWSNAIPIAYK